MWVVIKTGLRTAYSNTKSVEIFYDSHISLMVKISFRICPEFQNTRVYTVNAISSHPHTHCHQ